MSEQESKNTNNTNNFFSTKDFVRRRLDQKTGIYTEVDYSPPKILKHQVFDKEGNELETRGPYKGYRKNMSELDILRREQQQEREKSDRIFTHNSNIDGMIFNLERSRADLSNAIEKLHQHQMMIESDKRYREINIIDYFKNGSIPSEHSHNQDLIASWDMFKTLVDKMQNEIDRIKSYDNLKHQNKK